MSRPPCGDEPPDDPRSDAELIDAFNAGDVAAFGVLYRRHRDWVVNLAWRITRDRDLAHDVLQETFMSFLRQFPGFRLTAKLRTYLFRVVCNAAFAAQRRRRRRTAAAPHDRRPPQTAPPEVAPPEVAVSDEALRGLAQVVDGLPPGQRDVLMLRYTNDLSLAEISTALKIPVGTVKTRLYHGLRRLHRDKRTKKYFAP